MPRDPRTEYARCLFDVPATDAATFVVKAMKAVTNVSADTGIVCPQFALMAFGSGDLVKVISTADFLKTATALKRGREAMIAAQADLDQENGSDGTN